MEVYRRHSLRMRLCSKFSARKDDLFLFENKWMTSWYSCSCIYNYNIISNWIACIIITDDIRWLSYRRHYAACRRIFPGKNHPHNNSRSGSVQCRQNRHEPGLEQYFELLRHSGHGHLRRHLVVKWRSSFSWSHDVSACRQHCVDVHLHVWHTSHKWDASINIDYNLI